MSQVNKYFLFIVFLISCNAVSAYSIGISPDSIFFNNREKFLAIFNPNNFDVDYQIEGCNYGFLEFIRDGKIALNSKRILLIRYNPALNEGTDSCNLRIKFSNNLYSTGFSVPLVFSSYDSTDVDSFFAEEAKEIPSGSSNYSMIIAIAVFFVIILIIIIKFL